MIKKINFTLAFLFYFLIIQNTQANITISPVILEINAQNHVRGTSLNLENNLNSPNKSYEITTFSWKQNEKGEEVLTPSDDLIVNPKTVYIPSGEQRQVRIGFKKKLSQMDLVKEKSWRIVFQEIVSPLEKTGLGISVDFSVPLFAIDQPNKLPPNLLGSIEKDGHLMLRNLNKNHLKIMNVELIDDKGKTLEAFPNMKYILPDQVYILKLKRKYEQQTIRAKVKIDQIEENFLFPISH